MDAVSIASSIIAVLQLTATVINYLNNVKDAPKDRARFAIEAANLYNLFVELKYRLEEGGCNDTWYTSVQALGVENGPLDQYKHALMKLRVKISSGGALKKIGNALAWMFSKEEVNGIILRVERLKSLIQIALEMDHFKLSQAVKSYVHCIHDNNQTIMRDMNFVRTCLPALEEGVGTLHQNQTRQQFDQTLEWISSTNFPAQQSDLIARRQEGTGEWFLTSTEFTKWFQTPRDTLYCPGIPGAGKTMIAAITIDHLVKYVQSEAIGVAYIYCNYKAQADQTVTSLLASILKQLVCARPCIAEPVLYLHEHHSRQNTRPSLEEIFATLQSIIRSYSSVYLILDALDECAYQDGTRGWLLAKFHELQKDVDLRIMVTSRFIHDMGKEFKSAARLEIRANDADVRRFIEGQIYRLPNCVQRDEVLQEFVKDRIVEAVDGMFLLAGLYIDSLRDKRTKSRVRSAIEQFSKSLGKAYDGAIKRIEAQLPEDRALAERVLSWITYSMRPLTPGELRHALAVDLDEKELDRDNILDVEDILSVCAGLVIVDEESNIIRLVHYTAQKYIEQIRESRKLAVQQEITRTCLAYLSFDAFRSGICSSNEIKTRLDEYVFLKYAAQYWGRHAQNVQEQVLQLASSFLQNYELVSSSIQTVLASRYGYGQSQFVPRQITGLHLAAKFGLLHLSQKLLSRPREKRDIAADSRDSYGRTPLSLAAEHGQEAVVKLLVERNDVDANLKDRQGRTPLSWAAGGGHAAVVKLLVERDDVDADSKDEDGRTPLSWASWNGSAEMAKLVAERSDIDKEDGWTPLLWAARGGHDAVVKLLAERNDVPKAKFGRPPLPAAPEGGHDAVVRLLVEREDVDADSKDRGYGRTPLSWAAGGGHASAVKLLVERGDVDANSKDNHDRTPLSLAAQNGHEAVVKLLVGRGDVDADSKDQDGRTPLALAAARGHKAVVKLLAERDQVDVDFDSKNKGCRNGMSMGGTEWVQGNNSTILVA